MPGIDKSKKLVYHLSVANLRKILKSKYCAARNGRCKI